MVRYSQKLVILLGLCISWIPLMQGMSVSEQEDSSLYEFELPSLTEIIFTNKDDLFKKYNFGDFPFRHPWISKLLFAQYTLMMRGNMHAEKYFRGTRISGPNPTLKELATGFSMGVISQAFAPIGWVGAIFALGAAEDSKRRGAVFSGMATAAAAQGLGIYYLAKKVIDSVKK